MLSSPHSNRSLSSLIGLLGLGLSCLSSAAVASDGRCEDRVNTQEFRFSVTLPDNNTYSIAGYMYWQGQLEGKVLQIALHGGSYNHTYWDVQDLNGHPYSYARYMACHGFAVLALDNLGTGESSKPDGDFITIPIEAIAVHQIIQGLGSAPVGHSFRKIVLVGHSMGSLQAIFLQGTFHDADAVVVTGWENTPHMPANVPPEVITSLLSEPNVVFGPFLRTLLFYGGNFDPAMPDYDNANLVDNLPRGVFAYTLGAMAGMAPSMSQEVTVPVLLVFDEYDVLFPMSLAEVEASTYPNASSVTTHAYGIGHDLNLHLANVEEWARMKDWIRKNVGGSGDDVH